MLRLFQAQNLCRNLFLRPTARDPRSWSSQEASARVKFLKGTVINSYMTWFQSFNDYKVVYEENDGDTRLEMKILSNKDVDMCLY